MEIDGERGMARGGKVYCDGTVGSKNQKQTSFALFTCDNLGACVCVSWTCASVSLAACICVCLGGFGASPFYVFVLLFKAATKWSHLAATLFNKSLLRVKPL